MVSRPRTAISLNRIRSVNSPRRLQVQADEAGVPVALRPASPPAAQRRGRAGGSARWYRVEDVLETWRIDEEWWRPHPIHRVYYRVFLRHGAVTDVYFDETEGRWYEQRYD